MTEMVERVTAALWEKLGNGLESLYLEMGCGRDSERFAREEIAEAARAASAAMREPTEAMVEAARNAGALDWSLEPGEGLDGVNWADAYRAMIDAALNETPALR
jgi:hypothetical protein